MKNIYVFGCLIALTLFLSACQENLSGQSNRIAISDRDDSGTRASSCADTDGGQNFFIKGNIYGNTSNNSYYETWDACVSYVSVNERYCTGRNPLSIVKNCQTLGNYICTDGRCVVNQTNQTCADTDGLDYNVKGKVYGAANGIPYETWDYCYSTYQVSEWICNGNIPSNLPPFSCSQNCQDGKCVNWTNQSNTCTDSDGGNNIYMYGIVHATINGTNYTYYDDCMSGRQREWWCNGNTPTNSMDYCPQGYQCTNGACVVNQTNQTNTCTETDGGDYPLVPGNITQINQSGTYNYKDTCAYTYNIYEYYCQGTTFAQHSYDCRLYGPGYACTNDQNGRGYCFNNNYCYDSDGSNIWYYGFVTGLINGTNQTVFDSCIDLNNVREWTCNQGVPTSGVYTCFSGTCQGGKCMNTTNLPPNVTDLTMEQNGITLTFQAYVSDPNPGDQVTAVQFYNARTGQTYQDNATPFTYVWDTSYHDEGNVIIRAKAYDGEVWGEYYSESFIYTTTPDSCNDTDGGQDVYVQGAVYGDNDNVHYYHTDSCYGSQLDEYYCQGTMNRITRAPCPGGYTCESGKCVIVPIVCTDTDGGYNIYMQGIASGYINGVPFSYTDSCIDGLTINEWACIPPDGYPGDINYTCAFGNTTYCSSGRCY